MQNKNNEGILYINIINYKLLIIYVVINRLSVLYTFT